MGYKQHESSIMLVDYIGGVKGKPGGSQAWWRRGGPPGSKGSERSEGGLKPMRVACRYSRKVEAPLWKK